MAYLLTCGLNMFEALMWDYVGKYSSPMEDLGKLGFCKLVLFSRH